MLYRNGLITIQSFLLKYRIMRFLPTHQSAKDTMAGRCGVSPSLKREAPAFRLGKASLIIMFLLTAVCSVKAEPIQKHIALVFDDGPTTDNAPKFLEIFKREDIHVTFGYIGTNVEKHPDIAKNVIAAGHEIANHSYAHLHPNGLKDSSLEHEILFAQEVIIEKTGYAPRWYWRPYVESDPRIPAIAARVNLKVYMPNLVSSDDWKTEATAEQIKQNATSNITDGTTILFHEFSSKTVEQLPAIIAELKKQGCVFLTFSELVEYLESQKTKADF